ncbi:NAD(P)-dependent oxidoreductase [Leptothermofonsia sp. ETS-13]|uniref:NAD(P)-dependent oxidoreductase n=1 Tax=Leptothermofonsia sp. ETS-13 TaxID=3035696 RepID=UPI003B9F4A02
MKVGLMGTGLMGLPMAQRLLEGGLLAIAYNRTPEKLEPLRTAGVEIAPSPQTLIHHSTCIVLMLTNAQAIRETLLTETTRGELAGKTVIQMGTIAPTESQLIRDEVVAAAGAYLEAPVLGSIPEAKAGKLIVMVGATPEQFENYQPVFKCFGPEPILIGPVGTATATKLALNQLIASLTAAFSTSLSFVMKYRVDIELFMQILRQSALYAPTFDKKLQRMVERNFANPNFPTKHLLKDNNLFLSEAKSLGINTRLVAAVSHILQQAIAMGLADEDYSALFSAIEEGGEGVIE